MTRGRARAGAPRPMPAALVAALAPVLVAQGVRVRRATPRLPEAAGPREGERAGAGAPLRVLIAGDSSAAGVGAATQDEALAGRLCDALAARSGRAIRWRLVARTGVDARELLELVGAAGLEVFDVAIVVVGVNDVTGRTRVRDWIGRVGRLRALLAAASPEALVVASGLPPMHRFPALPQPLRAFLGGRARHFDAALAAWAASVPRTVHLPIPDLDGPGLSASDGFHPGPAAYRLWAGELAAAIERACGAGGL